MHGGNKEYDASTLGSAIRNLSQNLAALRDFVDLVQPVLRDRAGDDVKSNAKTLLPLLVAFSRMGVGPELDAAEEERIREKYGDTFEVKLVTEPGAEGDRFEINVPAARKREFASTTFKLFGAIERRIALLYGSSLVSLLSSAEWYVSQLLHVHFRVQPGALGLKDKVYSLEDLQAFGGIDDARAHLVDSKIESTLRGSIEDWLDGLKSKLGLSMGYVDTVKAQMIEVGQRRNLIVHNGGIVNAIYMAKVEAAFRKDVAVGRKLTIDRAYLDTAIALIERVFTLIGAEFWKKLDANQEARGQMMNDLAYQHLLAGRWSIAESLSFFTIGDKALAEHIRLVATVNYWQAVKWQERFDEIKQHVENADFSAKDEVFQLSRLVLLDQHAMVAERLPALLRAEKLSPTELESWPLFREFRATDEFQKLKSAVQSQDSATRGDA